MTSPSTFPARVERAPLRTPSLAIVASLRRALEDAGLAYCHWKSNEHVGAAVRGDTDLDLLVERRESHRVAALLAGEGYKRFAAVPSRAYPGVEDWLGFDADTGRLVHVHLHHRLTLGERHLKGHRLPWEARVLASRRRDPETGLYLSDPHLEVLLLVVRAALKLRWRDRLRAAGRPGALGADARRELRWLAARVEPERVALVAAELVGPEAARRLRDLLVAGAAPDPSTRWLLAFRSCVRPQVGEHRSFGALEARARRWWREGGAVLGRLLGRRLFPTSPQRRVDPHGGVVVAVVGADGSGKSTIAADLTRWLSWKLDVLPLYFGSGDGPASLPRRLMRLAARARRRARTDRRAVVGDDRSPLPGVERAPHRRAAGAIWDFAWALLLVREKRARLRQARRARDRGMIVVCDRYPQAQVLGINDGPLLGPWLEHPSAVLRALARRERAAYEAMETALVPDLVVRLRPSRAVALRRKSETPAEVVGRKLAAVDRLRYPAGATVLDIDADQPLEQVVLEVRRAVWDTL